MVSSLYLISLILIVIVLQVKAGLLDAFAGNINLGGGDGSLIGLGSLGGQHAMYNNMYNQNSLPMRQNILNTNNIREKQQNPYNKNTETREKLEGQKEKLEDLLGRLQELNRLKEQEKMKQEQGTAGSNNQTFGQGNNLNVLGNRDEVTTIKSTNPTPLDNNSKSSNSSNENTTGLWKMMNKRKILFQVQPVVPETEKKQDFLHTVYYMD